MSVKIVKCQYDFTGAPEPSPVIGWSYKVVAENDKYYALAGLPGQWGKYAFDLLADSQPAPVAPDASAPGIKHDGEKPDLSLLSSTWLMGVGRVLTFGKRKYAAHNWRKGLAVSRLVAAALRHIIQFMAGEDKDPETGESHLYHASCCLMFAAETIELRPQFDDRWKAPTNEQVEK